MPKGMELSGQMGKSAVFCDKLHPPPHSMRRGGSLRKFSEGGLSLSVSLSNVLMVSGIHATKQRSVKNSAFSLNGVQPFSE